MKKIKVIITWLDNYGASSPSISGCVATARSIQEVKDAYASALEFHIEGMRQDNDVLPLTEPYQLEYELNTQALLHQLDGKLTRAAIARATGINQRQLGHYMTGRVTPRTQNRKKIIAGIRAIGKELINVV